MAVAPRKFKTGALVRGKLTLPDESASKALIINSSGEATSSVTTDAELAFLSGVTSSVQTQLTSAQSDATQAISDAAAAQSDIDAHIGETVGAHAASAISTVPAGNLIATDVQSALNELQTELDAVADISADVADLVTLSGVAVNSTDLGTFTGSLIPDSSTVKSALQSLETVIESLPDPMEYKGLYNASTNSPALTDGTGNNGDVYQVTVAGSQDFGSGSISFEIGDKVVYNGTLGVYEKWDMTDAVTSVNGQSGVVVLDTDDIAEGAALYFTEERAQDAVGTILASTSTVTLAYADATPEITAEVITQLSLTSDASGVKLVGDEASPGNTQYYGTDGSGVKGFHPIPAVGSPGDLQEGTFAAANNQATPADVTGLAFANGVVRSFSAIVSVAIDATSELFEEFELHGIQRGADWSMSVESTGDESGIAFSITTAGQIQYVSANSAGFVSSDLRFRAQTLSV